MSYLTLDADRLVRDAVDAFLEGRISPDTGGDCVFSTRNSQYRVADGVVQEASDTSLMGAELVAWLVEELGQPLIEPVWRPYARAIFVDRQSRQFVLTSRTITRTAISGPVSPVPALRRRPSVIPPAPPIPFLRSNPPPGEANERETQRPPPEEATIAAERSAYDELLEASKTPLYGAPAVPALSPSSGPLIPRPPPAPRMPPRPAPLTLDESELDDKTNPRK